MFSLTTHRLLISTNNMEKLAISKLISRNDDRITYVENQGVSDVWPSFSEVNVDNVFSDHVLCIKCKALLKWKSRDGTSGLKAHIKILCWKSRLAKNNQVCGC